MSLTTKRLLVLFSIALNIGFICAAAFLIYNHEPSRRPNPEFLREILAGLDLPPEVEQSAEASMENIEAIHEDFVRRLHQARNESLQLLASSGPLDQDRFVMSSDKIVELMIQRDNLVRQHLLELRRQLGDQKGAAFFAAMLKQVEKMGPRDPL